MKRLYVFFSLMMCAFLHFAQAPTLDFVEQNPSGPALVDPVDIASRGDGSGRLFIVEKRGTVRIVVNNVTQSAFFLDVRPLGIETGSECGLLGLAFHPDPDVDYVYVYYTKPGNPIISRVSRFDVNAAGTDAIESTEEEIINVTQLPNQGNHKAGDIAFGPDGYLYIALGDGGGGNDPGENGQDGNDLLGKILRIDIDGDLPYEIPPDNPFVDDANVRDEIWAMGMRNPWRFSFDRETGDLWIADVGQGMWEEVDFEPAGSGGGYNYGWDCYEGDASFEGAGCLGMNNYDFPVFVYPHNCSQGCPYGVGNSITGGFVYRGQAYEDLQGYYICADYGSETVWMILKDGNDYEIFADTFSGVFNQLTSFGESDNGELYAVSLADELYRVTQDGVLPIYLTHFDARNRDQDVLIEWKLENVIDAELFTIERSNTNVVFTAIGTITPDPENSEYSFVDLAPSNGRNYYRLVTSLKDGGAQISEARVVDRTSFDISADVQTSANGSLAIHLRGEVGEVTANLYSTDGKLLSSESFDESYHEMQGTEDLSPGIYVVVLENASRTWVHKWYKSDLR